MMGYSLLIHIHESTQNYFLFYYFHIRPKPKRFIFLKKKTIFLIWPLYSVQANTKYKTFSNVLLFNKQELCMVACDSEICRV